MCTPPASPAKSVDSNERCLLEVVLRLECITPVIGGGVQSFEPDIIDIVRVPAIRGQLRYWWRACQPRISRAGVERMPDADALFLHEARTWGGVSVPERGQSVAWKSRVRISVENVKPGPILPAGRHEVGPDGRIRSLPVWTIGPTSLGYALFPLQQPREVLREHEHERRPIPTRQIREKLEFTLRVQLLRMTEKEREHREDLGEMRTSSDDKEAREREEKEARARAENNECSQLLAALWALVHFGGIGARTRRGFGALAASSFTIHHAHKDVSETISAWEKRFVPPDERDVASWIEQFYDQAKLHKGSLGGHGLPEWPVLHAATRKVYPSQKSGLDAQGWLLEKLQRFRQGVNVGRDPGTGKRAGKSRWPEADWLKHLVDKESKRQKKRPHTWNHPPQPFSNHEDAVAPRAAFGLPIVVSFIDRDDSAANTELGSTNKGGRWASPLLLRPIRCKSGVFVPVAIAFDRRPGRGPLAKMTIFNKKNPDHTLIASGFVGARNPIKQYLGDHKGDAIDAFFDFVDDVVEGKR